MDHEETFLLLSELLTGDLPPNTVPEVLRHVEGCEECRETLRLLREVRRQVALHGTGLLEAHAETSHLHKYAMSPDELPVRELAGIGGHLLSCPACTEEFQRIRSRPSPRPLEPSRGHRLLLFRPIPWQAVGPVFAIMVGAILYSGYLTVLEVPRIRTERAGALRLSKALSGRASELEDSVRTLRDDLRSREGWSGGIRQLFLPLPTRGVERPEVRVPADQPYLPIVVEWRPKRGTADRRLDLRLAREESGAEVCRLEGRLSDFWDPGASALSFMVPVPNLRSGNYVLEIRSAGASEPECSIRFHLLSGGKPQN